MKTFDLKEGGGDTAVTRANRHEYVGLYVRWLLVDSVKGQYAPFERCGGVGSVEGSRYFSQRFFFFFFCGARLPSLLWSVCFTVQ